MSDHTYEFRVAMSCGGCSGAVTRVLNKLEGVKEFDVSLETKIVKVTTEPSVDYDTVLNKIGKTGKKIESGAEIVDGVKVEKSVALQVEA
ncbi:uncharacterized protein H6S33_009768 [Morchella sextelata]|uniref:uncharacterized protein n=1 Tax=Morchella sextelata TaxID=1174677 RepID=UPI001D054DEA|nr:uncharacterized protein H6S33_009768 [Morchella sextelata]KAH0613388.1 hypothetical protein H6S33_009768 [Morchella sextelata]